MTPDEGDVNETASIQIHRDKDMPMVSISVVSARVLAGICDLVSARGSAAKFEIALAQQELEAELMRIAPPEPEPAPPPVNRATRRQMIHG